MTATSTYPNLTGAQHSAELRKAVIAATVGTTIEWYDFFIYGTAAGLVFPKLFFPNEDPLTGTLLAFTTYFIGFVGRPIGAAIFGHYGDRIGRKATLIVTLLVMGIATVLVAFVPSYASIGIWGAIILTVLRALQGIGVGGEWGGSVLIAMEWARTHGSRGLVASWPQFGVPSGLFLANLAILAFSAWSGSDFISWGWRIPFLLSIVLIGIGIWIRLGILETPVFKKLVEDKKIERAPILEVIKKQPREIILSALLRMAEQAPFYIFTAFVFAYGVTTLKMSRDFILTAVLVASCLSFVSIPLAGHISDRIGRRKMYLIGAAATGLFGFLYFGMLDTAIPSAIF
ncbi:MAG TPA: MFS transporter, partial [Alphaproteobacteria bacterium]|nr:MFS transporter [Alphaproteobacteria bacterium]